MTTTVCAQETGGRKFISISHSPDRTIAKDSTGNYWIYNDKTDEFEPAGSSSYASASASSSSGRSASAGSAGFSNTRDILPPEIRCTDVHHGDLSDFLNEITVEEDQRIEGTVISFHDITIKGLVTKDVVSFRTVRVTSTGEVRGDVVARNIKREPGGRILGQRQEVPFPDVLSMNLPVVGGILSWLSQFMIVLVFAFVAVLLVAVVPKPLERITAKLSENLVTSFFWGILFWFALLPVLLLLVITIIGIPLLIIYPLAIIVTILLGFTSISMLIGKYACRLIGWTQKSLYMQTFCGVIALELMFLIGSLSISIGMLTIGLFFTYVSSVIGMIALTVGIGAVVSARFGMKSKAKPDDSRSYSPMSDTPTVNPPPPPSPPPPIMPSSSSQDDATE